MHDPEFGSLAAGIRQVDAEGASVAPSRAAPDDRYAVGRDCATLPVSSSVTNGT